MTFFELMLLGPTRHMQRLQWEAEERAKKMNKFVQDLRAAGAAEAVFVPDGFGPAEVSFAMEKAGKMGLVDDGPRADLAVAYPASEGCIGFTLTVAGKPQQFTMKRSAAASFIGRMAEVLAK